MIVIEWNIKGGAAFGWDGKKIEVSLSNEIFKHNADVVILTEFVLMRGTDYLFTKLDENEYLYFTSCCSGKNGILIAIKKQLVDYKMFIDSVYKNDMIFSHTKGCNILKVELPLKDGKNIILIGCRMETGYYKDLTEQYNFEKLCFNEILLPAIRPIKKDYKYILAGDFNNARCRGNLNSMYDLNDYIDGKDNSYYSQYNYNLNIIKDEFEAIGFEMVDKTSNGEPIMTHKKSYKGKYFWYPDDHMFINGFSSVSECQSIPTDKSDHNILWAKVE